MPKVTRRVQQYCFDQDRERAFKLGADGYLIKPIDGKALLRLVEELHSFELYISHVNGVPLTLKTLEKGGAVR